MVPTNDLRVKYVPIGDVRPYEDNPRRNDGAVQAVANSLREFGWKQPIVVDADGTIVVGHTRYKAALALDMTHVPVVVASDLTPEQCAAYRLADNRVGELATWDNELLAQELDGLTGLDMEMFGFKLEEQKLSDEYSKALGTVDYEPSGEEWEPERLFTEPVSMDERIDALDCPEELKRMLRLRQAWFVEFDYSKIADYYATQASPETQRVIEDLGLVLLDRDGLIEHGFSSLVAEFAGEVSE